MGNIHEFPDRGSIEAEAREWLIRLDSEIPLGGDETEALHEWLNRSPAHRRELRRISTFWDSANILTELAVPLTSPRTGLRKVFSGGGVAAYTGYGIGTVAAALLIFVSLSFMEWNVPGSETTDKGIYASTIGQIRSVVLQDGTTVHLNTDSLIEVDYSGGSRKIRLLRGESHFQVVSNSRKPFEVYAQGNLVRAVGTAFSVHLLENDVKVTVEEGKVELIMVGEKRPEGGDSNVSSSSQKVVAALEHGQSTTFGSLANDGTGDIVTLAEEQLHRQFSWREGVLSFSGEPLIEVVNMINRYTFRTIDIVDPELEALPIGGRFRVSELEEIFEVLQTNFGIRVSRVGKQHILLRAEREK
ncbi:MAG: FecR domain-containing protein [Gammaproteobacteria bacterium]